MPRCIMALDAGTTSSRCILFDADGRIAASAQKEFTQHFPRPGLVEHDAMEIWRTQLDVAREALEKANLTASDIAAIGIANQRETVVVWDRRTGQPVCPAIVWQDRRTAEFCRELTESGFDRLWQRRTGLIIDPYFSATKLKWILDNVSGARERAEAGELLFGTIDTWLIWNLTGGRVHATDCSNASRTMMFNITTLDWDDDILRTLNIPRALLPEVKPSGGFFGETAPELFGGAIPVCGAAGDQQAALFGQTCFRPGMAKNTYGTGCFLLMNTGDKPVFSKNALVTTVAWSLNGRVEYALEGSVFVAGSAIQWLRDELGIIATSAESETLAEQVKDSNGCFVVPAFTGLGAPYWDAAARGAIVGLTRGVNRCHLVRATLESLAYQTGDVLSAMEADSGIRLSALRVDGGASANDLLMQIQSDLIGTPVVRPACVETTAMGAAFLAGLTVGFWKTKDDLPAGGMERIFRPTITDDERGRRVSLWHRAVERARGWETE